MQEKTLVVAAGSAGTGKAQPLDSKVLTDKGWRTMREIVVGDLVRTQNGYTKVLAIYPQGKKDVFKIKLKDGGETECCKEHLWTVHNSLNKSTAVYQTVDTAELIKLIELKKSGAKRNISLPVLNPAEAPAVSHIISPYILGCLIGDGGMTTDISFTNMDEDIISRFREELSGDFQLKQKVSKSITYSVIKEGDRSPHPNLFKNEIIRLGLHGHKSNTKFIPIEYKAGSLAQKYDMIQGLLDTDGTVSKATGAVTFCTTSEQLALDLREMILDVGGKASISSSVKYFTYKGIKKQGLLAYIVSINALDKSKLFHTQRKKELVSNNDETQLRRIISDYEYVGEKECQCILVEDDSHLYVTDDYILTHNTLLSLYHASKQLLEGRVKKIVLIRAYQPLAGRSIGFLPGELEDKLLPYYAQMLSYLEDFLTVPRVEVWRKSGAIEICSLETIRGRSWDYSIIIADECQNLYAEEIQALTTRIGEGSQMILMGDNSGIQSDIKNKKDGLSYLLGVIDKYKIEDAAYTKLGYEDILRSGITREFVIAFDKELQEEKDKAAKPIEKFKNNNSKGVQIAKI